MIIVVTTEIQDKTTRKWEIVADFGVDEATGRNVVLPAVHPSDLGAKYNDDMGEYVMEEETKK